MILLLNKDIHEVLFYKEKFKKKFRFESSLFILFMCSYKFNFFFSKSEKNIESYLSNF